MTTTYKFKCAYTKSGVGTAPSPDATCTVVDSANNILANAQAVTVLANLPGVKLYSYTGADGLDLIALFHTTDATVDQQDLYSYTPDIITTRIDAAVSSRAVPGDAMILTSAYDAAKSAASAASVAAIPAAVWANATRTLTLATTASTTPAAGDPIVLYRDCTNVISFTGLGNLSAATKLWLTVKTSVELDDSNAILQVEKTGGLLVLNRAATVTSYGALTVTDAVTGAATLTLTATGAALLPTGLGTLSWDIKQLTASGTTQVTSGQATIATVVTRTIN